MTAPSPYRGFGKSYAATPVFASVDLDVAEGEMCILLGPSGCGKTTLLRAIAGLVQPDAGRLMIAGQDVTRLLPQARGIAMMFQHYALFPNMTVRQNLAFGLQQQRLSRAAVNAKVDAALHMMDLTPRAEARPAQLSGGQKQRVALARALVLGDQVAVMNAGRIVQAGPAREVYDRPATRFVAGFIGDFNLMDPAAVLRVFGERTGFTWAIHPEAFDVLPAPPPSGAEGLWVEAAVTDLRIHGPVLRYLVMAQETELKVDALNRASIPARQRGEQVWLRMDRSQVREVE